jgi:hypothetical protein
MMAASPPMPATLLISRTCTQQQSRQPLREEFRLRCCPSGMFGSTLMHLIGLASTTEHTRIMHLIGLASSTHAFYRVDGRLVRVGIRARVVSRHDQCRAVREARRF